MDTRSSIVGFCLAVAFCFLGRVSPSPAKPPDLPVKTTIDCDPAPEAGAASSHTQPDAEPPQPDSPWSEISSSSSRFTNQGPPLENQKNLSAPVRIDPGTLAEIERLLAASDHPDTPRFVIYEDEQRSGERLTATPGWSSSPGAAGFPALLAPPDDDDDDSEAEDAPPDPEPALALDGQGVLRQVLDALRNGYAVPVPGTDPSLLPFQKDMRWGRLQVTWVADDSGTVQGFLVSLLPDESDGLRQAQQLDNDRTIRWIMEQSENACYDTPDVEDEYDDTLDDDPFGDDDDDELALRTSGEKRDVSGEWQGREDMKPSLSHRRHSI